MALPNIINEINTIKSTYLPKSGGTLTGNIAIHTSNADISLGYKNLNDVVYTKPTTRQARAFRTHDNLGNILGDIRFGHETSGEINTAIIARYTDEAGTRTNAELKITPNASGTVGSSYLKFNGYDVVTSKGGYTVNGNLYVKGNNYAGLQASSTSVTWGVGSAWNNAPCISLYSPAYADLPGVFAVRAISSDGTRKELVGKPDGTLSWNGKSVVCATTWVSGINGYRKYSDGIIEQWGLATASHGGVINLHTSFTSTNYCVYMLCENVDSHWMFAAYNRTTTNFNTYVYWSTNHGTGSVPAYWYARGK